MTTVEQKLREIWDTPSTPEAYQACHAFAKSAAREELAEALRCENPTTWMQEILISEALARLLSK